MTRAQWALARTKRFLTMLRGGKVKDAYRKADGDLLPEDHKARLGLARVLTVYAGPPCAGKSETAKRGEHGAIIDVDDLLDELGGYYSASASRQAHALALQDLDDAVARGILSIAVVAPLLSAAMRDEYAERAASAGYASRLVYVTAELPVLEGRNRKRSSRRLRMAALRAMAGDLPEEATAFDRFDVLDTSARPPQGVRDAARNGLERHRAGETGDGIEPRPSPPRAGSRRATRSAKTRSERALDSGAETSDSSTPNPARPRGRRLNPWGGRAGLASGIGRKPTASTATPRRLSPRAGAARAASPTSLAVEPPGGVIQTATGSSPHYRDGLEVTIRGVTIYPESFTTLETEIERRAAIDRQFDEVLDEVIAEVTDELEQAAEVSATRLDEVEVEARQKVADAIEASISTSSARRRTPATSRARTRPTHKFAGLGVDVEAEDVDAPRFGFSAARIRQAAEAAARKMVGDIRGRLERFRRRPAALAASEPRRARSAAKPTRSTRSPRRMQSRRKAANSDRRGREWSSSAPFARARKTSRSARTAEPKTGGRSCSPTSSTSSPPIVNSPTRSARRRRRRAGVRFAGVNGSSYGATINDRRSSKHQRLRPRVGVAARARRHRHARRPAMGSRRGRLRSEAPPHPLRATVVSSLRAQPSRYRPGVLANHEVGPTVLGTVERMRVLSREEARDLLGIEQEHPEAIYYGLDLQPEVRAAYDEGRALYMSPRIVAA